MKPLSTHYRHDDTEMDIEPDIIKYLDNNFLENLANVDKSNPKVLIIFSGGNAVGKSTLAEKLSKEFNGIVIENDAVKRHALQYDPELANDRDKLNKLTWQYTMNLYSRLDSLTPNGLIIRDGIIDWYHDRILPIFEKNNYKLFIIGFDISREKAIELIKSRGDTPTVKEERFYALLDDHDIHIKRFRSKYKPDVILSDNNLFDHEIVVDKLKEFIKSIKN